MTKVIYRTTYIEHDSYGERGYITIREKIAEIQDIYKSIEGDIKDILAEHYGCHSSDLEICDE